jgi:hypothetical protein
MKKSVLERTNEHIVNLNKNTNQQLEKQKAFIRRQRDIQKKQVYQLTQGENALRYTKWGMKAGYVVLAGGLVTTLFSPWRGLGVMAVGGVSLLSNFYHIKRLEEKKKKEN